MANVVAEDVLGEYQTHYWSADSSSLCYATFNDTEVPTMSWPVYGNKDQIYPTMKEIGYAKVSHKQRIVYHQGRWLC